MLKEKPVLMQVPPASTTAVMDVGLSNIGDGKREKVCISDCLLCTLCQPVNTDITVRCRHLCNAEACTECWPSVHPKPARCVCTVCPLHCPTSFTL